MQPLDDIRVLDFTTLLPGPFATLILAEAGAEIIKIERPGGEEMRASEPRLGHANVLFSTLNRGKKSVEIDLKQPDAVDRLRPLIESADVLVEQFRPGVMKRLGLDYETVEAINPRIVYCSITGYGQGGPKAHIAGHDLNYCADTGFLSMTHGADGKPAIPQTQIADIGAGTYPAVMNIMFGLWQRQRTGKGSYVDIAMTDNLFPFLWMPLALGQATGEWTKGNDLRLTGATPRYQIYRTADGGHITVGALEQKFWDNFCDAIALDEALRDDAKDPPATIAEVARIMAGRTTRQWEDRFAGKDVCCAAVRGVDDARNDAHYRGRDLFAHSITADGQSLTAVPVPVARPYRSERKAHRAPVLGGDNGAMAPAARRSA